VFTGKTEAPSFHSLELAGPMLYTNVLKLCNKDMTIDNVLCCNMMSASNVTVDV